MATVKLYLKDKNAHKVTKVICAVSDGRGVFIKVPTSVSVNPKHWSVKNQRILSANSNAVALNQQLEKFKNRVFTIYLEAKNNGLQANAKYIKEQLHPKENTVTKEEKFWKVFDNYLELKTNSLSISSIKKIKSLRVHLRSFEEKKYITFDLEKMDQMIFERLQDYMYKDADLNVQTTAKYLGLFKTFLNWCKSMKIVDNDDHKQFSLTHQPETLKPILDDKDIDKLRTVSLTNNYLDNARELLILSTLTGLRFSDYSKINLSQIRIDSEEREYLVLRQTKTNERIEVPLNSESSRIVHDLIDGKVRAISNQKLNQYVKEVCKLAGIDDLFEVDEFKGTQKTTYQKPKYELITTHTGRRTFATRLLLKGVPTKTVMKFTGHKDERSFSKYVNIPKEKEMDLVRIALSD
ncbi:site-specific integrase [Flammeovirga sp. EKP202]|uniref:site-specific integrase n=1 Tax=Flammeovirga sp. EKP202 TaxID=2770592 RepID=UPI00165FE9CD|nr:site-specific integrase [Flammeovirga sp. EKP202]MBD0402953.1 tyrosine-type recombinase/integrase [Flammeovirga sp. EKP202]